MDFQVASKALAQNREAASKLQIFVKILTWGEASKRSINRNEQLSAPISIATRTENYEATFHTKLHL